MQKIVGMSEQFAYKTGHLVKACPSKAQALTGEILESILAYGRLHKWEVGKKPRATSYL